MILLLRKSSYIEGQDIDKRSFQDNGNQHKGGRHDRKYAGKN